MKTKYKYIEFIQAEDFKGKQRWTCQNRELGNALADIFYYKLWKEYVSNFNPNSIFNNSCLRDIADFLDQLNNKSAPAAHERSKK
jgi:hypothetical protein